jgi:hypothetical protein
MDDNSEALVATLQLLLSDVSDDTKRALFCRAFPDSFLMFKGGLLALKTHMSEANTHLKNAADMTDGQSPLGRMAIEAVNRDIGGAHQCLRRAAAMVGVFL